MLYEEYTVVCIANNLFRGSLEDRMTKRMNEMLMNGWQVVHVTVSEGVAAYITFGRPALPAGS